MNELTVVSEIDKAILIKEIVKKNSVKESDVVFIESQLTNENKMPVVHIPIKKLLKLLYLYWVSKSTLETMKKQSI